MTRVERAFKLCRAAEAEPELEGHTQYRAIKLMPSEQTAFRYAKVVVLRREPLLVLDFSNFIAAKNRENRRSRNPTRVTGAIDGSGVQKAKSASGHLSNDPMPR